MEKVEVRCRTEYSEILKIEQISSILNENGDIHVNGSVTATDNKPKQYKKVRVYANLCDESGNVLYVLNSWKNISLDVNSYFSFSMYCASVKRFMDVSDLKYVEIYPMFNEKDA